MICMRRRDVSWKQVRGQIDRVWWRWDAFVAMGQRISSWGWPEGARAHRKPLLRRRYRIESVAVPEVPAVVALMTAFPIASAKARPFTSTLARSGWSDAH